MAGSKWDKPAGPPPRKRVTDERSAQTGNYQIRNDRSGSFKSTKRDVNPPGPDKPPPKNDKKTGKFINKKTKDTGKLYSKERGQGAKKSVGKKKAKRQ